MKCDDDLKEYLTKEDLINQVITLNNYNELHLDACGQFKILAKRLARELTSTKEERNHIKSKYDKLLNENKKLKSEIEEYDVGMNHLIEENKKLKGE